MHLAPALAVPMPFSHAATAASPALPFTSAAPAPDDGLSGVSGWVADTLVAGGEVAVASLALAEVVFPPLPSELVLPLAGYLSRMGRMHLLLVLLAATAGALAGNLGLYALGRRVGTERAVRLLARLPLVGEDDARAGQAWFDRHGTWAVFLARFVPLARAMVSLPAGAARMPLPRFVALTTLGCLLWNGALVVAGYLLGAQHHRIAGVLDRLDLVLLAGLVGVLGWALWRRRRGARVAAGG
ncbi:MAG: DedA family protein [Kineosporiaceae bacterium]